MVQSIPHTTRAYRIKGIFLLSALLIGYGSAFAQKPAVHDSLKNKKIIKEVQISSSKENSHSDKRLDFTGGQQKTTFDSILLSFYQNLSLSELIMEQSSVFVKSYGVNSMATLNIRGSSAAQSTVLWNGIPINGASAGVADISLLQGGLFDNIQIQYGGSSALFGSGNVGGALLLNNKEPDFKPLKKIDATLGAGSFGQLNLMMQTVLSNQNWHFGFKVFREQANNNFSYQNRFGDTVKMENARLSGIGAMFDAAYLFPTKNNILSQTISLKLWYQDYDREIPPALFEHTSVKRQRNKNFRSLIQWNQERKRSLFYTKLSFNTEELNYKDGVVLPNNDNLAYQWYGEAGWKWAISKPSELKHWQHELMIFTPLQYAFIGGQNRFTGKNEFRPALAAAYQMKTNDEMINLNFMLRHEWWNRYEAAWLPGWNGRLRLIRVNKSQHFLHLNLLANVQKSYRVPNLNELYFSPGGNPNLVPERGWNEDAGLQLQWQIKEHKGADFYNWKIEEQISLFNRSIKDWIYWLGGAIWTPHNLAEVHSKGIETETSISRTGMRQTRIGIGLKTAYILATTSKTYLPNDNSLGKQIPYTPRYNGMLNLFFSIKDVFINYNHQYTGYRFVTTDESQFLKPYNTGNLQISYSGLRFGNYRLNISSQIRNILNSRYEIINGRPMPGRNYLLSLSFSWEQ